MKKEQFDKLKRSLTARHYKKYNQKWRREDYILAKGYHKENNIWEDSRSSYQIILSIYDFTIHPEYWDSYIALKETIDIEIRVLVSRTIDENFSFETTWYDDTTIEDVEKMAEDFYKWICQEVPTPRIEEL